MSQEEQLKRIADALEKVTDIYEHPEAYLERISQGVSQALGIAQAAIPSLPAAVQRVEITLSPEERAEIMSKAVSEIEQQFDEVRGFIVQALSELPEEQLKKIGKHLKEGRGFKLRRRLGCIYLDFGFGDEDFHLKL